MSRLDSPSNQISEKSGDVSMLLLDDETKKLKELENRVKKHLSTEYKPVYRDAYEEKMIQVSSTVPRDILEGLKKKLKTYVPKPRNGNSLNKRLLNGRRRASINTLGSDIDSRRASSVGRLSDIFTNKPEKDVSSQCNSVMDFITYLVDQLPDWLKKREEFRQDYFKNCRDAQKLVISICEKP
jgi:hypothetical protein